jgi:hypothetical protein
MGAGRKLKIQRREALWADKDYKKSHLGSEWKKPFAGCSHAKGIVLEKMYAFSRLFLLFTLTVSSPFADVHPSVPPIPYPCTRKRN